MNLFITITFLLILIAIAYQDFKHLRIYLIFLILALLTSFVRFILLNGFPTVLVYGMINLAGTLMILLISVLWMFLRKRKIFNPINTLIGSADLFFLPVLCFSFSPLNYIVFIIGSSLLITIGKQLFSKRHKLIPLAGSQAIMLVICICISEFSSMSMYNDAGLLKLLS